MTMTMNYTDSLCVLDCASCGLKFGMSADFERRRRNDHGDFYCPSGHINVFSGKTDEERAKAKVAELERRLASRAEDVRIARMQRDDATRSLTATKGALTRVRKRAEKGVCQHCNRHFVNVERHVAGQHAELVQA